MDPAANIWQVALALAAIVGVVVLLGFIAKRLQVSKGGGSGHLRIVDSAYLGPKERLLLVQVADQHVLVGMNAQCITRLAQYPAGDAFAGVLDQVKNRVGASGGG